MLTRGRLPASTGGTRAAPARECDQIRSHAALAQFGGLQPMYGDLPGAEDS
jgi:hypothetical protein